MHPLIQEVTKMKYGCQFEGIPNLQEKFPSFTIIPPIESCLIRIIDSLQFLPGSLSSLVETQKKEFADQSKAFLMFYHVFRTLGYDKEQIAFLLKKNEFPYKWPDLFDKLNTRSWDMPMKTYPNFAWLHTPFIHQCLHLYLICNVVQLADILAAFVNKIMPTHHIFPWWLWGGPSLSFKVMLFFLKDTPYHLVEIPDPNMTCVFAHAVRGGQSLISKRYSKANENTKILYLDTNNLYIFRMSRKLPVDDFKWEVKVLIQQALADLLNYWRSWIRVGVAAF